MLWSIAKAVCWFRPKRIVMHACLWGKYLNKLEKLLPWSLISLNCSITTTADSVTMTAMIYIVCHGKQTLELLFSDNFFSRDLKKLQNISVALSLSILHTHFRMIILWGEHVYLVSSGGARNYVVHDVLPNFLQGARTFVHQTLKSLQPWVLLAREN